MKVTRELLHEMLDKLNESDLHRIYDVLQSILEGDEFITNSKKEKLRKAKRNIKREEVVSLVSFLKEKE